MKFRRLFVLLGAVLLIASACGGSSDGPEAASPKSSSESSSEPGAATAVPAEVPAEAEPAKPTVVVNDDSPIEAMLGIPVFDDDAMNDWFRQLDVDRRRLTAECMIAEGFEYSPELPATATTLVTDLATSSREYAAAFGYGIVAGFNAAEYDPSKDYGTKNDRYVQSLSEAETEAFYLALYGATSEEELVDIESPFGIAGCEGAALEEVFSIVSVLEELGPVADDYYDQILADSRSIALYDTWSTCMAEAGFGFALPDDARESFYGRLNSIVENEAAYQQVEIPEVSQSEVFSGDSFGLHPKLTESAQAQLDELLSEEIANAVANWDCRAPLIEEEMAIQREYEQLFVTEVGDQVATALGDS